MRKSAGRRYESIYSASILGSGAMHTGATRVQGPLLLLQLYKLVYTKVYISGALLVVVSLAERYAASFLLDDATKHLQTKTPHSSSYVHMRCRLLYP